MEINPFIHILTDNVRVTRENLEEIFREEAGIFTILAELVLNRHFAGRLYLSWSAVTGICCGVIVAALVTIIRRSGLREEVRRRMHI